MIPKFRIRNKENGVIAYPSKHEICPYEIEYVESGILNNKLEILMYTGLKDRTGKEVYSGDSVRIIVKDFRGSHVVAIKGTIEYKIDDVGYLGAGFGVRQNNGKFTYLSNICNAEIEVVEEKIL